MILAMLLLLLPMAVSIDALSYEVGKSVVWIIFWIYLFKSYKISIYWFALFVMPVIAYNPIFPLELGVNAWSMLNGFFFVLAFSWVLKRARVNKSAEKPQ